jgi:hypothetical protein
MLPTEDLFACVYVLIDDLVAARIIAIPPGPGPAPACSDAELLAIAQVRYLLGRRSEAGFLAEVTRDWAHLFPHLPHQSEANRRIRWLRAASGQLSCHLARQIPADDCQQIDTSALPVKHAPRVRGPTAGRDLMGCMPGSAATPRTPNGSTASASPSRRTWAAASSAPGRSSPPPSTSATRATTCWRAGHRPETCLRTRDSTAKLHGRPGQPRHRRAPPACQGKAPPHAADPAENHRRMAQPDRDHLQRDHRPDGTRPPRRAHLLGPAHPHCRDHRCSHPHASVPGQPVDQPA